MLCGLRTAIWVPLVVILQSLLRSIQAQDLISVWTGDTNGALDVEKDMNLNLSTITQRFLSYSNTTVDTVISNNDVRYFLATNGSIGSSPRITFLSSTLVIKSLSMNLDSYVLYKTQADDQTKLQQIHLLNRSISIQPREIPSNFNPKTPPAIPNLSGHHPVGYSNLNCFDARTLDTTNGSSVLVICKATTTINQKKMARVVAIRIFPAETNAAAKNYSSVEYENDSNTFQTVSWTVYSRSLSSNIADTLEGVVIITDLMMNGTEQVWAMIAGSFVTEQSAREFNISRPMVLQYATQPSGGSLSGFANISPTSRIFSATVSNTFITTAASRTSRNILMLGFTMFPKPTEPASSFFCWEDSSGTNSLLDRMITRDPNLHIIQVKCGSEISSKGLQSMARVAKLANDSDYFLRVSYDNALITPPNNSVTVSISYTIIKTQPVRINVASMTIPFVERSILNNTIVVPAPFNLYPYITSAVDSKVFYTCWRDYTAPDRMSTPCIVMDYFWVNATAYNDANDDTIINTFPLMKREMGPFSTVAIDFDSVTNTSYQMAMVPEFKAGSTMVPLAKKVISIYNLTRAQFSVVIPPSSTVSDYVSTVVFPDIKVLNQQSLTQRISYQSGMQNVWLNYGYTTMWIPFKAAEPTSVSYFGSNTFFKNNSAIVLNTTEPVTPSSFRSYRFELEISSTQPGSLVLLVDRIITELYTKDNKYFVHTRTFNIMANKTAGFSFSIANSWPLGTWSSSDDLFKQANLKKVEHFHTGGIFLYFEKGINTDMTYGIVRMDKLNPDLSSCRISKLPMLMYETKSTIIILTLLNLTGPVLQLNQLNETSPRDINASVDSIGKTITQTEMGPQLKIQRLEDIDLEIYNNGQTVAVNILAEVEVDQYDIIVASRISWTNRTTGISTANFLEIEYQKALELPFSTSAKKNFRCIYNTSVVFLELVMSTSTAHVHVYNLTRWSYFTQTYTQVSVIPEMTCMGEMVAVSYTQNGTRKTDIISVLGELRAVNRVRDSTIEPNNMSTLKPFAFSRASCARRFGPSKILLIQNELTNVYFTMNYPKPVVSPGETIRGLKPLLITNFFNSEFTVSNISMNTYLLLKTEHIESPALYIGNETLEDQKKILYEANLKQTYRLEDNYRIPTSFFDVNLVTSDPTKIQVLKRIREIKSPFNLWNDSVGTAGSNQFCDFSKRGIEDISIVNDIMLRVDARDQGFCMEISRISVGDSVQIAQADYMKLEGATVSDCRLLPDKTFGNSTGWETIRSSGPGTNFVITCINSEKEKNYFWALFINVQPTVQNVFKPKTNLLRMEIKHKFTYYKAVFVNGDLYFGFYDASSRKVYYAKDAVNILNFNSPVVELSSNSTGFELSYLPPSQPGDRPQTGIWMLLVNITMDNNLEQYKLSTLKMLSNGSIAPISGPSAANQLNLSSPLLNQSISNISCASMTFSNTSTNLMACAYTYHSSRNVMWYNFAPAPLAQLSQNYVAPYADFEIRQLKVFFWNGIFSYISINFSPTSGKKYLLLYRHDLNKTSPASNPHNVSVYLNSSLLMHGTIDLTNTSMDLNNVEINYFTIGSTNPKTYIGLHDDRYMRVFEVTAMEITIDSNIQFSQISSSRLAYINYMGNELTSYSLNEFFREKKGFTMLFVWVLLASLGLAGLLVALYMTFKKKPKIDESQHGLKELRGMTSDRQFELNSSINLEMD